MKVQNGQTLSNYWQPSLYEQHLESTNTTTTTEGTVIKSGNANFDNLVLCTNWNNNCNAPTNSNIFNLPNNQLLNTDFKSSMTRLLSTSSNGPAVMEQNPVSGEKEFKTN
ncbi:unnamed protein product [Heterobilharzia americana]|nr:unnamed protein product [Heterobilharzia americana]